MSGERHQRVDRLFHAACELSPEERPAFLERECADDVALLREVEAMLAFDEEHSRFLDPAAEPQRPDTPADRSSQALDRLLGELKGLQPQQSRYQIHGEIARGGMGAILRIWDKSLRRNLAMKVILGKQDPIAGTPPDEVGEKALARFIDEAHATGQLDHPGIVPVHELGVDAEGRVYFTMKLVKGEDLQCVFDRMRDPADSDWSLARALGVLQRVCEAMAYAHSKNVIHRDLKPANIMVGRYGEVYVMDWGLARVPGAADQKDIRIQPASHLVQSMIQTGARKELGPDSPLLTMDGDVVGTPAYMSPEQARGELDAIEPASDVYSVGAILYHMICGHMPYVPPGSRLNAHVVWGLVQNGAPRPLYELAPDTPPELVAICEKAMAREVTERYADMSEMAADMRAYIEGRVVQAHKTGALTELKKWVQRNKTVAATAAAAVLIIGLLTTWYFLSLSENEALALRQRDRADANAMLAEQRTGEAETEKRRVLRLSDTKRLSDLRAQTDSLWPAHPENLPALTQWLEDARDVLGNLGDHKRTLHDLRLRGTPGIHPREAELTDLENQARESAAKLRVAGGTTEKASLQADLAVLEGRIASLAVTIARERPYAFSDEQDAWWHDTLDSLVSDLVTLTADDPYGQTIASMTKRLEFAATIENKSINYYQEEWNEAIASIADRSACPQYNGLRITGQLGLVPIGQDPDSGLWEFWHVQTGTPPQRDENGRLLPTEETGLVFVLIPGGTFWMGAQSTDRTGQNYDPLAQPDESPVHMVKLDAYFLSKYELTQGQWRRITGSNPSARGPGYERGNQMATLQHPVEGVSWKDCVAMLKTLGLLLPTEAQWENGCRAGTDSPWWTGTEISDLDQAGNLADQAGKAIGPGTWKYEPGLNDGFGFHAPVGRLQANAFGLHDVIGNILEWCLDDYGNYSIAARPGDGRREVTGTSIRVGRGGAFGAMSVLARSARRGWIQWDNRSDHFGARPARFISE